VASRFYLDTSAYLTVLLGERGATALARELVGGALLSSTLLAMETYRNLIRLSRERLLSPTQLQRALVQFDADIQHMTLRDLTFDLCQARTLPVVSTPRTLDLVHLSTAVWFHQRAPLHRFVSLDARQNVAAAELGLPV